MQRSLPKLLALLLLGFAANYFASEASASILDSGDAIVRWSRGGSGEQSAFDSRDGIADMGASGNSGHSVPEQEIDADQPAFLVDLGSSGSTTSSSSFGSSLAQSGVFMPFVGIEAPARTHAVCREVGRFIPDATGSELLDPPRVCVNC